MNWNLVLHKYPRSILENENALLLLAILEQNGLATEDELNSFTNFDKYLYKKLLLDLQLNQLIQYRSNFIRLTRKGKIFIDRFNLVEPILSDLVEKLGYKGKEKEDFEQILFQYRSSAFDFYQNSLCTIKTWEKFAETENASLIKANSQLFLDELLGGTLSLLLRDLRNWWTHSPQLSSVFININDDIKNLICSKDLIETEFPETWDTKTKYAVIFLNKLENSNFHFDSLKGENKNYKLESLISAFHIFQYNSKPFEWYGKLCMEMPLVINNKTKEHDSVISILNALFDLNKNKVLIQKTSKSISRRISTEWIPTNNEVSLDNDMLETIMLSSDIQELSLVTGIQESSLHSMITDIRNKCNLLLGVEQTIDIIKK